MWSLASKVRRHVDLVYDGKCFIGKFDGLGKGNFGPRISSHLICCLLILGCDLHSVLQWGERPSEYCLCGINPHLTTAQHGHPAGVWS